MESFNQYIIESKVPIRNWDRLLKKNPKLQKAITLLKYIEKLNPGSKALIVGGAVRDLVRGKQPKDYDIATNADLKTLPRIGHVFAIGQSENFNIVGLKFADEVYEVANFRAEGAYSDSRHPDTVEIVKDFVEDAGRRDFTINALGLNSDGVVEDHFKGLRDIEHNTLRAVGNPKDRFTEDKLRMLRAVRFAAKLNFTLDRSTKQAIQDLRNEIQSVAPERIKQELISVAMDGKALAKFIELLDEVDLLSILFPEIKRLQQCEQTEETHPEGNAYEHTLAALRESQTDNPITNLAILFHDLGKGVCKSYNEYGKVQYKQHEHLGTEIFNDISRRLKFSNKERDEILFVIKNHMLGHLFPGGKSHHAGVLSKKKLLGLRQNPNWNSLKQTIRADDASRGKMFDSSDFDQKINYIEQIFKRFGETQEFEAKMSALINGKMIMDLIPGIAGKDIGQIKSKTRDFIIQKDFNVTPNEVINYVKVLGSKL